MDVSKGRAKVASACGEQSFAFRTGQGGDEVCCFAAVAEDFGGGARVCVSFHVGFASAVVNGFTRVFAFDSKSIGEITRGAGSAKSVEVELALLRVGICRGHGAGWHGGNVSRGGNRSGRLGRGIGFSGRRVAGRCFRRAGGHWSVRGRAVRRAVRGWCVSSILLGGRGRGVVREGKDSPWCRYFQ